MTDQEIRARHYCKYREKILENAKVYRDKNREKINEWNKAYYHRNKDKINQKKRDKNSYKEFRDYIRQLIKEYEEG